METVGGFIFLGSKITADGDCTHKLNSCSLEEKLWQTILKSRDITLPTKAYIVNVTIFPIVMYRCSHICWAIKKAEHWRIDVFELWYGRRLLRAPCTARKSNQSILKEINTEYSLEGLMLKLKLQYLATWCKESTHWKRPWCWERVKGKGERGCKGWDG